ncbi:MAG: putative toxin-antitoxin system toxin component, PIN family [Candidatus Binatia bacterium]
MKLVFDTNVIIAGIVAEGLCRELLEVHVPAHEAVLSDALFEELVETLRAKFDLAAEELPIVQLYRRHARRVEIQELERPVCRDRDDDRVLATALAGEVAAIVTGDSDLLTLGSWKGIERLTPRQFLERHTKPTEAPG